MNLPGGYNLQNGKYQLTKVIGQGGFGITYLGVWHTEVKGKLGTVKTEVPICIKEYFFKDYCFRDEKSSHVLIHSETGKILFDKFKEKLIKEAKILSDVHHPYIVNVLEVFEENNTAYIAMEHISGCSLKYMLDVEGILPENKVLRYISQIGQALDFVHQKNILHLDIKPSNILIDKKNNARLIDFGVSKRYDIEQQETSTTMLTLSKGFAPIEQYDNEGTQSFSPCPDVYSLGATMYYLLTGVVPVESILRATRPLAKPSELNKAISSKTENAILTAMKVNPVHRYQSVKAMINELDIPSYFEDMPNLLTEEHTDQHPKIDEEGTELLSDTNGSQQVDDEKTHIGKSDDLSQHIRKKKRKRRILIPVLIFIFAFLGYGVAYFFELNGLGKTVEYIGNEDEVVEPLIDENTDETDTILSPIVNTPEAPPVETARPEANDRTETGTSLEGQNTLPEENVDPPTAEMIDAEYNALIESGKAKMSQKNYAEAKDDFGKAQNLRLTPEVLRLIDESEVEARKANYQEFMTFGNLTIVKKLSNGLWGAIDNRGEERIRCEYLGASPSGNNKAFERTDHLYDIFDANGERVGWGLTEY